MRNRNSPIWFYSVFDEVFVQVFCPFLNWVFILLLLTLKSALYVLDSSPLSGMSFVTIFFQSVDFPLLLLNFISNLVFHTPEGRAAVPMLIAAPWVSGDLGESSGLDPGLPGPV